MNTIFVNDENNKYIFMNIINVEWFETLGYLSKIKYVDINRNNINTTYLYFESKSKVIRRNNENNEEYIFPQLSDSFRKYADA